MDISAGLIAKGTAGALAASAAVGGGIWANKEGWLDFNKSVSNEKPQEEQLVLTKFDEGLINFLKIDGGDIVFEVKKGGKADVDLTEADFIFNSSNNKALPLTTKVTINTKNTNNLKEKSGNTDENGKITTLQNLNSGGNAWTWTCKVKLEAKGVSSPLDGKTINDQDKIFKATEEGLFGLLKKNDPNGTDNATKKAKEKFIKFCAKERGSDKNKAINSTGIPSENPNNLKSEIIINLKLGAAGQGNKTDENKLYPTEEDDGKFNELFG